MFQFFVHDFVCQSKQFPRYTDNGHYKMCEKFVYLIQKIKIRGDI